MFDTMRAFIAAHPILAAALSSLWGAIVIDLMAFLKWKSWDDAHSFDVRLALLRYTQSLVGGFVGTLAVATGGAAVGLIVIGGCLLRPLHRSRATWVWPLVLIATLGISACGGPLHVATVSNTTLVQALHTAYVSEGVTYRSGLYSRAKHDSYLRVLKHADEDALVMTDGLIAAAQAGGNARDIAALVASTKAGLQQIQKDLQDANAPPDNPLLVAITQALTFFN